MGSFLVTNHCAFQSLTDLLHRGEELLEVGRLFLPTESFPGQSRGKWTTQATGKGSKGRETKGRIQSGQRELCLNVQAGDSWSSPLRLPNPLMFPSFPSSPPRVPTAWLTAATANGSPHAGLCPARFSLRSGEGVTNLKCRSEPSLGLFKDIPFFVKIKRLSGTWERGSECSGVPPIPPLSALTTPASPQFF